MHRRWPCQTPISINDRESGKISLNLDELLKTPPNSPFLMDNMSISISKTGVIFPSSSNNPSLFDFATNYSKGQIIEEKSEDVLLSAFPSVRSKAACTSTGTRYSTLWTYTTYQIYCIWYIFHVPGVMYLLHITTYFEVPGILRSIVSDTYLVPGIVLHLASFVLYLGFWILTFNLASGMIIVGPWLFFDLIKQSLQL